MCPLTGRSEGSPAPASPSMARRPVPAARTTWSGPRRRPSARTSSGPASSAATRALDERHPAAAAGLGQRAEQGAVVDLVVAGDLDAAAQGGAERGDQAAALAGAAAVRLEAERVLVGEEVVEAGAIGRIERDRHRAGRVVADGVTGGGLQRGGEGGPAAGALHQERGQGGLAELRLGDRGQHAGRHPRRAVAPGGRRDHRHFMTVA